MHRGFRIFAILQWVVAAAMACNGFLVAVRPYVLLDVVLPADELRDPSTHDRALELLQRATSNDAPLWFVFAAIVAALGFYALRMSKRSPQLSGDASAA